MYKSRGIANRNVSNNNVIVSEVESKTCLYERPYNITGIIVETGLEEIANEHWKLNKDIMDISCKYRELKKW